MAYQQKSATAKRSETIQIVILLLLWIYIVYRATFLPITQDEAYSYLLIKTENWRQMTGTPNTHWLNSLFAKVFISLPGFDSMWKIRMLSMISWILYGYSTFKISSTF